MNKNRIKNKIIYIFPKRIRHLIIRLIFTPMDILDVLLGRRKEMVPPRRKIFTGYTNFVQSGNNFVNIIVEKCRLKPDDKILDVGCGIGRMARAFTKFLFEDSEYEGFDIFPDGITWCKNEITPRYPNFNFTLADIYNKEYNPHGKFNSSNYKFPYPDNYFDFVFLSSIFTHMLPKDMENYLSEISRVLKNGGKCWISYFLLNPDTLECLSKKESSLDFKYSFDVYKTIDKHVHETGVAFDENYIRDLYIKNNLKIIEPISYGSWRSFGKSQDEIIASA